MTARFSFRVIFVLYLVHDFFVSVPTSFVTPSAMPLVFFFSASFSFFLSFPIISTLRVAILSSAHGHFFVSVRCVRLSCRHFWSTLLWMSSDFPFGAIFLFALWPHFGESYILFWARVHTPFFFWAGPSALVELIRCHSSSVQVFLFSFFFEHSDNGVGLFNNTFYDMPSVLPSCP